MNPARHPYRLAASRQLADADLARHVADLVRLVLLTGPGERLHRPDFGAGLGPGVLFEPVAGALVGLVEMRARGALAAALGDRITVEQLTVAVEGESTIAATLVYRLRAAAATETLTVRAGG